MRRSRPAYDGVNAVTAVVARPDFGRDRLYNQRLLANPLESPEQVVGWLCAVQAQDYHGAKWGVAQRTRGTSSAALDKLFDEGRILRTHIMRPTWHFVLPADIRWLLMLTSPRVHAANASSYRRLELGDALFARSQRLIAATLQGGRHCTRAELAAVLAQHGINTDGQRVAYLLMRAELDGVICSGALRGRQFTYALLDERVPDSRRPDRETALAELARRYFTSHGPASVHDFAWWSGLSMRDARAALASVQAGLEHHAVEGRSWWFPRLAGERPRPKASTLHLLPNYDEHIVAYKDHRPSFDADVWRTRKPRDDRLMAHNIVRDGLVIGGWRRTLKKTQVEVQAKMLVPLRSQDRIALHAATEAYGRFLGLSAILTA
jgi:hypothetical protein